MADRVVRALDLSFGGPDCKSHPDCIGLVHGSPKVKSSMMHVNSPSLFASGQLGFFTLLSLVSIICLRHLLSPTNISAINNAEGKQRTLLSLL